MLNRFSATNIVIATYLVLLFAQCSHGQVSAFLSASGTGIGFPNEDPTINRSPLTLAEPGTISVTSYAGGWNQNAPDGVARLVSFASAHAGGSYNISAIATASANLSHCNIFAPSAVSSAFVSLNDHIWLTKDGATSIEDVWIQVTFSPHPVVPNTPGSNSQFNASLSSSAMIGYSHNGNFLESTSINLGDFADAGAVQCRFCPEMLAPGMFVIPISVASSAFAQAKMGLVDTGQYGKSYQDLTEELDSATLDEVVDNTEIEAPDRRIVAKPSVPITGSYLVDFSQMTFDSGSVVESDGWKFLSEAGLDSPNSDEAGDLNGDGNVNLLDVNGFIYHLSFGFYRHEADINGDGDVNLLDVNEFIDLLSGN